VSVFDFKSKDTKKKKKKPDIATIIQINPKEEKHRHKQKKLVSLVFFHQGQIWKRKKGKTENLHSFNSQYLTSRKRHNFLFFIFKKELYLILQQLFELTLRKKNIDRRKNLFR
jgi:hypothetical protein